MSERANYFKLGLFVIVATSLLLVVVAALGAKSIFRRTVVFETCFKESVQGLDVGSAVKLRGVQLGKVSDIMFALDKYGDEINAAPGAKRMENFVIVEMSIGVGDPSVDDLIHSLEQDVAEGLRVRLSMAGITGGSFLELVYLDPAQNPPMELAWTPDDLYIPSTQSLIGQITSAAERIARELEEANIGAMLANLNHLLVNLDAKVAQVDVTRVQSDALGLLDELRATTKRVQTVLDNPAIDSTLTDVAKAAAAMKNVVAGGEGDLAAFIKDLPEVAARAKATLADIERILTDEQTKRLLANLSRASDSAPAAMDDARELMRRLNTLVASQQQDIESIVVSLRRTLENLDAVSADAKRNPSRILFGDPPPRIEPGAGGGGGSSSVAPPGMRK